MTAITDLPTALKVYNELEDTRDKLRTEYNEREKKLVEAQEAIQSYMIAEMRERNLSAIEVPGQGMAKIVAKRRYGCGDWGVFWNWVVVNNRPDMLQKRLLDSAVDVYLEAAGELPPAVNTEAKYVIAVTKRPR